MAGSRKNDCCSCRSIRFAPEIHTLLIIITVYHLLLINIKLKHSLCAAVLQLLIQLFFAAELSAARIMAQQKLQPHVSTAATNVTVISQTSGIQFADPPHPPASHYFFAALSRVSCASSLKTQNKINKND